MTEHVTSPRRRQPLVPATRFLTGLREGTFTLWQTSLQEHVPAGELSRVSSYDYLTSTGLIPLGNLTIGFVTAAVGLHRALLLMSVVGLSAAACVAALPAVRRLPRVPA
jgi:hypothetical protein